MHFPSSCPFLSDDLTGLFLWGKLLLSEKGTDWRKAWFINSSLSSSTRFELFSSCVPSLFVQLYRIRTVVGGNGGDFSGDGGLAIHASLNNPTGLHVCSDGRLLIADTRNHRVREVSSGGIIRTIAGTGEHGISQDGLPALSSKLKCPRYITVDRTGRILFTDPNNNRICALHSDGTLHSLSLNSQVPQTGQYKFEEPDGLVVTTDGRILFTLTGSSLVQELNTDGRIRTLAGTGEGRFQEGILATQSRLHEPRGMCLDVDGTVLFADCRNHCILRIDSFGNLQRVAGRHDSKAGRLDFNLMEDSNDPKQASLLFPEDVSVDSIGRIWIVDSGNHCVRMIGEDGVLRVVTGIGELEDKRDYETAEQAELSFPRCVRVHDDGRVFIADTYNHCVRVLEGWF